ncbi:MAG: hypothetical protein WC382_02865 [Methanoregulaceae archaeon]|jgi:valyl-tRNA synthetase
MYARHKDEHGTCAQSVVRVRRIKSSLNVARTRTVICKTTRIEEELKRDLLKTRENFLSMDEMEKIVQKEDRRKKKQARAMAKARVNLLRQKEKIKTIQAVRKGNYPDSAAAHPATSGKQVTGRKGRFHAIDVSY